MSTSKYSLAAGLFNKKSPVPKISGQLSLYPPSQGLKTAHSTSSKRKLNDQIDLKQRKNHAKLMVHQYWKT